MIRLFAFCLLLTLLCACAAVLPATPATPTFVTTAPAAPEPAIPSATATAVKPTETQEPTVTNTPEAPKIVFGGATKPNTYAYSVDAIDSSIHFEVPREWTVPLTPDQLDPNPLVASGDLGGFSFHVTGSGGVGPGAVASFESWGMDFRGIELVKQASDPRDADQYVAGFSFVSKGKLYVLTMPIYSGKWRRAPAPISQDGEFLYVDKPRPDVPSLWGEDVIRILKDPKTIGRRMVITIWTDLTKSSGNAMASVSPGYPAFDAAVTSGTTLPPDTDIRVDISRLHMPIDLVKVTPSP